MNTTQLKPTMEFVVEFEINPPEGTPDSEVVDREEAEAAAAGVLIEEGHLVRVWRLTAPDGESRVLGLYRADDRAQLNRLLGALPLYEWMHVTVMALEPHPSDPGASPATQLGRSRQPVGASS